MAAAATNQPNWKIALGIPLLIFLACLSITFTPKFKTDYALLAPAILADLLIVVPLVYFLAIRKTNTPKWTVLRVFVIALLGAGCILPAYSSPLLPFAKTWISPAIEALVIFIIARKFYTANKQAKANNSSSDFLLHCRRTMLQVIGNEKIANLIASEIAVFYYALGGSKKQAIDYQQQFTTYKENGLPLVLFAILSIFLIETMGVHFLLALWNKTVAWVLTGLSLYTCLQLFGHIRALKARPILIHPTAFQVRNGLVGDAFISFDNIDKIERTNKVPKDRQAIKVSLLKGLENHNIVVYLKTPIEVTKLFGFKKQTDTVLFFVDKPRDFINVVTTHIS